MTTAEDNYARAMLDVYDGQHATVIASMKADVDRLRDEWATSYAEQRQRHEDRLQTIKASIHGAPASPPELAAGGREDGASVLTDTSVGHNGPQQQPPDLRAAELAEVERIRSLSWDDYADERRSRGIGSPTSARGLFAG
jgi:hypothetical protein